ncbi:fructosamine kinase family protein, partial [Pelagibacteraceae bacterium]|nr:fructosamine kinase family protein [Pelagibacteraceae bacterium]
MSYLDNDDIKPSKINNDLVDAIVSIHSNESNYYGFEFNTQIGGLEQYNEKNKNWIEFYGEKRLGYVFNLINKSNSMGTSINSKIETLIYKLNDLIPKNPRSMLLHGDLWEGNILFKNKKFSGFIDPGSFYGHNELEIAYLTWFNPNFIKRGFLEKYNNLIKIDKEFKNYEPIYQLYYSLLNVLLWDRNYIIDVKRLLKKIKV